MKATIVKSAALLCFLSAVFAAPPPHAAKPNNTDRFSQVNLVSDVAGAAQIQDPSLVNAWGISFGPTTPFWVSDNGTGKSTLYVVTNDSSGNEMVAKQGLEVNIPGEGTPTGQLFNNTSGFRGDLFIFASEDGTISGWRGALGTNAEVLANRPTAVYKGIAKAQTSAGTILLAANFREATIDVYNSTATLVTQFADPAAPAGYAPFNVQSVDGIIFVTFAKQDEDAKDDVAGPGHGLIDILNPETGAFVRFVTGSDAEGKHGKHPDVKGSGGKHANRKLHEVDSPWGIALAPESFGRFGGDLLVGNFGSGTVMAFDAEGNFDGLLKGEHGGPLQIDGLWGLSFGNGHSGSAETLFFTAGPDGEGHGLFGSLGPVTQP
jgi:hypothetical protein